MFAVNNLLLEQMFFGEKALFTIYLSHNVLQESVFISFGR